MSPIALYVLYALLGAGAAGLYLALPSSRKDARRLRRAGALVGSAAVAGLALYLVRWVGSGFEGRTFFVIFAVMAVLAAGRVVTHAKPVYSALYFVLVVLAVTVLCVLAAAEFLAAALVIIYGGAILVTYVFVIMLAQQAGQAPYDGSARQPFGAVLMGFLLMAATTQAMMVRDPIAAQAGRHRVAPRPATAAVAGVGPASADSDSTRQIGRVLLTRYVMAVEVAGVLLLVAVVGAIAIARKRIDSDALTPEEQRQLREHEDINRIGREVAPF